MTKITNAQQHCWKEQNKTHHESSKMVIWKVRELMAAKYKDKKGYQVCFFPTFFFFDP